MGTGQKAAISGADMYAQLLSQLPHITTKKNLGHSQASLQRKFQKYLFGVYGF